MFRRTVLLLLLLAPLLPPLDTPVTLDDEPEMSARWKLTRDFW